MVRVPEAVTKSLQMWSKVICMAIRNQMENFHVDHLTDAQMKELNPIIRDAVFTTLRSIWLSKNAKGKEHGIGICDIYHLINMLPPYWEEPGLYPRRAENETLALADFENLVILESTARTRPHIQNFLEKDIKIFE